MQKSVAILYANLKGNIGDFAILDAMLRETARQYPGRRIDVYPHGFLDVDEARLAAFRAAGAPPFEIAGGTFHRPVPPKLKRLYRFGLWPWAQRRLIDTLRRESREEARRFAPYEAIFLAGGDQWNGIDLGVSMFATLLAVAEHNPNVYHYPFSLNPAACTFNTASDLRHYFAAMQAPIVVRDGITHAVLSDVGIPTVLGHDTVFSLSDLGQQIAPLQDRDGERILLVLTGPHDRTLLFRTLGDMLARLKGCGRPIEMLTTCWIEDLQIYQDLGREYGTEVRAPLTWQETIAELKQSAVVVTDRLHCLILGTFAECTLFPVGDRKKAEAFINDTGTPHHVLGMEGVTPEALEAAMADREAILDKIRAYRDLALERDTAPRLMPEADG